MALGFTFAIYQGVTGGNTHITSSATALQIKNLGPATAFISDGQYAPSDQMTHGWPLAPGESIRIPGGDAYLSVSPQFDTYRADIVVIEES